MCKCKGTCGCGSITIVKGEKGDSGATVNYIVNNVTNVAKALQRYFQQVLSQTYDIYNAGAGKDVALITMPTVTSANQVNVKFNAQIDATDIHNVTISIKADGVGIGPPARKQTAPAKVGGSAKTWMVVEFDFKLGGVTTATVLAINVVSDGVGVTPRLTDYYWELEIIT